MVQENSEMINIYNNINNTTNNKQKNNSHKRYNSSSPEGESGNAPKSENRDTRREIFLNKRKKEMDMLNRIWDICVCNYDEEIAEGIFDALEYYFLRFTKKTGLTHPTLTDKTLIDIIDRMSAYCEKYNHFGRVVENGNQFIKLIDAYFDEKFNNREMNWNLSHFMSDGILDRLAQKLWSKGENR